MIEICRPNKTPWNWIGDWRNNPRIRGSIIFICLDIWSIVKIRPCILVNAIIKQLNWGLEPIKTVVFLWAVLRGDLGPKSSLVLLTLTSINLLTWLTTALVTCTYLVWLALNILHFKLVLHKVDVGNLSLTINENLGILYFIRVNL